MEQPPEENLDLQLFEAAYNDNTQKATQLLKQGADANTSFEGMTALYWAAFQNNNLLVKSVLTQSTIEVNLPDKDGWTPLHWATCNNNMEIAKLLLAQPTIGVNLKTNKGDSALGWAAFKENSQMVKLLLNHINKPSQETIGLLNSIYQERSIYFSLLPRDLIGMLAQYQAEYSICDDCAKTIASESSDHMKKIIEHELWARRAK